ncbi:MAG: hypothetical protein HWD85_07790 [Flavobacteriaceae bacterium]|nr:hypothetical protein [Flavobacteriaceae bacterium]
MRNNKTISKESISLLEQKQKQLQKEIDNHQKRTPYFIIGVIFLSILAISLLDGLFVDYFGEFKKMLLTVSIIAVVVCFILIVTATRNITIKRKKSKEIENQIYNQLKLKDE